VHRSASLYSVAFAYEIEHLKGEEPALYWQYALIFRALRWSDLVTVVDGSKHGEFDLVMRRV